MQTCEEHTENDQLFVCILVELICNKKSTEREIFFMNNVILRAWHLKGLGHVILGNFVNYELQTSNWQSESLSFAKLRPHNN